MISYPSKETWQDHCSLSIKNSILLENKTIRILTNIWEWLLGQFHHKPLKKCPNWECRFKIKFYTQKSKIFWQDIWSGIDRHKHKTSSQLPSTLPDATELDLDTEMLEDDIILGQEHIAMLLPFR